MTEIDTKVALLQALIQGDSYGLELIERVREATGGRTVMMQGRVYPVLRELESDGLLESYDGEPMAERGGRPRRYYKITAEGRKVARAQARAIFGLLKPALGMS
jgi:PadR family transcriptional regulator PadR